MNDSEQSQQIYLLVVEDSRIQAQILCQKLREANFEVDWAEDGEVGLKSIRTRRPDLVISDIEMPNMTGYELCYEVKNDPQLKAVPFILLSTLSDAQDIIKGLHCGADNYVTKPYDPEFLITRVRSLLETPVDDEGEQQQLDVTLNGTRYTVKSGRQQILNLLVSTFENAVEKNHELARANEELTVAKEQLQRWNVELERLNGTLESVNQRMSRDLDAAARVQQSLLPSSEPDIEQAKLAWKYIPCDELAGDFLNYFLLDDEHLAMYVVDVSGHGVASSLLSVTIGRLMTPHRTSSSLLVQSTADGGHRVVPPGEVAAELNQRFQMEEQNSLFFTMLYGVLNLRTLKFRFTSAGHDPPVLVRDGAPPAMIEGSNLAIGWMEDLEYEEESIDLQPGDRLFLYSDGVPEALDQDLEQFTMQQMVEMFELGQGSSLQESVDLLDNAVQRWCAKNGPKDDVSILGLEINRT